MERAMKALDNFDVTRIHFETVDMDVVEAVEASLDQIGQLLNLAMLD